MSVKSTESIEDRWKNVRTALKGKATESILMSATKNTTKQPRREHLDYLREYTFVKVYKLDVLVQNITKRLRDTHWPVVIKTLFLVHMLMRDGNPDFLDVISRSSRQFHDLDSFTSRSEGSPIAVKFVRVYASYLESRLYSLGKVGKDFINCEAFDEDALFQSIPLKDGLALLYYLKYQLGQFLKIRDSLKYYLDSEMISSCILFILKDAMTLYRIFVSGLVVLLSKFTSLDAEESKEVIMYFSWSLNITKLFNFILHHCKHLARDGFPKLLEIPPVALDVLKGYISDEAQLKLLSQPNDSAQDEAFSFNTVQNIDREIDMVYFGKDAKSSEIWLEPGVGSLDSPTLANAGQKMNKNLSLFNPFASDSEADEASNRNELDIFNDSKAIPAVDYNFDPMDASNYAKKEETSLVSFNDPLLDFYSTNGGMGGGTGGNLTSKPATVYSEFDPLLTSIFESAPPSQTKAGSTMNSGSDQQLVNNSTWDQGEQTSQSMNKSVPILPNYDIMRESFDLMPFHQETQKNTGPSSPLYPPQSQVSPIKDGPSVPSTPDDYNPFM